MCLFVCMCLVGESIEENNIAGREEGKQGGSQSKYVQRVAKAKKNMIFTLFAPPQHGTTLRCLLDYLSVSFSFFFLCMQVYLHLCCLLSASFFMFLCFVHLSIYLLFSIFTHRARERGKQRGVNGKGHVCGKAGSPAKDFSRPQSHTHTRAALSFRFSLLAFSFSASFSSFLMSLLIPSVTYTHANKQRE